MGSYKRDSWKRLSRSSSYKYNDRIDFDNDDKFYHKEPFHSKQNGSTWDWSDRKYSRNTKANDIWTLAERIRSRYYKTHTIDEMFSMFSSRVDTKHCFALNRHSPREVFYWWIDRKKQSNRYYIDNRFVISDCGNYLIDKGIKSRKNPKERSKRYRSSIKHITNKKKKKEKRDLSKYLIRNITDKDASQQLVLYMNQHKYPSNYKQYIGGIDDLSFLLWVAYTKTLYGR